MSVTLKMGVTLKMSVIQCSAMTNVLASLGFIMRLGLTSSKCDLADPRFCGSESESTNCFCCCMNDATLQTTE